MTEPSIAPPPTTPTPPTLESVLRNAWDAFHPTQPAPLGWLTHTATQIQAYLHEHQPVPQPQPPAIELTDPSAQLGAHVWSALRDAVAEHDIDVDAANRVLHAVDLPLLPRRWQVRLALPILIEVTATSREDAFDTAEAAVETALTGAELDVHFEWDGRERDDANPGDLDPTAAEHPYPGPSPAT
ncbi:hypothetical protein M2302_006276 [Micromonospora sp. A200]|uniref:hypothetical protein n=1 Tax=Micromonospora sp. A200 TaxID=2940568 RepID=UPI002473C251|nr:hypothetical protein [Micromonospora sp. A200]MDH6466070.1 hypothetical protein [Micromonospora sp. A200]